MDNEAFERSMKEAQRRQSLYPIPVVERRSDKTFNAEVACNGIHYIVARNCQSREEALNIADTIAARLANAMIQLAADQMRSYPIAKE